MKIIKNLICYLLFCNLINAQVGIGTTSPNASLDISSTSITSPSNTDGILIPKMNNFPLTDPTALQDGMLVYATGSGTPDKGFYYWNNTTGNWIPFIDNSGSSAGISSVVAGNGLTNTESGSTVTLNTVATNGLTTNADDIRLGGTLVQVTNINQGVYDMIYNLNDTGSFHIQDNGTNHFSIADNGNAAFGGDVEWRAENTAGTILASLFNDSNSGRFTLNENGNTSVDLDANSQFIFNEQGFDRNFRIESNTNPNMLFLDAGLNRLSIGTNATAGTFNVFGNSYFSDDIYLRDGAVNGGDVLVRIFDSEDDGIIDVYENGEMNHRIYGNGTTVFNEQGNNNADFRIESDTRQNMFLVDASENLIRIGTNNTDSDAENGNVIGGVTIDYVADFDRGIGFTGTAIGIGSIEYILDNNNEINLSTSLSPTTHLNRDLGFSTTTRAWDDVYADNFINVSDLREKENITNIAYGLDEIMQMRPVSYKLKSDPFNETKLGLIAQEALVLVPEAVKTHDYKSLDENTPEKFSKIELERMGMTYNALIPVLIKATQEQQVIIEALKKEIEILKSKI